MLPSMPLISTPVRSPMPEIYLEEGDQISILASSHSLGSFDQNGSPNRENSETQIINHRSPTACEILSPATSPIQFLQRKSPCPDLMSLKKASPLKHVTPILKKYSAHRKAKCNNINVHPYLGQQRERKVQPCVMIKDDVDPPSPPEIDDLEEEDREEQRTPSPIQDDVEEVEYPAEDELVENCDADFDPPSSPLETRDNEEDLIALMRASSTITTSQRPPPIKRSRHAKELEATLACLKPEDPNVKEERENHLTAAYFNKVREELLAEGEEGKFQEFVSALTSMEVEGVVKTYTRVRKALEGHTHLASEFLMFLEAGQALECGQFMQHLQLSNMTEFITKLETFFSRQPHVVRMVISSLTTLAEQPGVTEEDVKATVLPLLRSSPLLTDLFLALLPATQPPESLMGDFEELNCEETEAGEDDEPVEMLHIPADDSKDPYGGDTCICTCHTETEDERYRTRADHCVQCGLKFIHGKIYLQSGKTLRPAKVSFLNEDIHSAIRRLTVCSNSGRNSVNRYRKRTGNSFSNDSSGIKDSPPKLNIDESDNEEDNYRSDLSSPKASRKSKSKLKEKTSLNNKPDFNKELLVQINSETKRSPGLEQLLSPTGSSSCDIPVCDSEVLSPQEPDGPIPCDEELAEEEEDDLELDLDEEVEEEEEDFEDIDEVLDDSSQEAQNAEVKEEPPCQENVAVQVDIMEDDPIIKEEQATETEEVPQQQWVQEEEAEVKDEVEELSSSQSADSPPLCSGTRSTPPRNAITIDKDPCWTRDEDKAILQAFQQGGNAQRMLLTVKRLLPERTAEQIMSRFQILLKLLQQMSSAARESSSRK